jgi:hypothetical protein
LFYVSGEEAMQAALSPLLILLAALAWGVLHSLLATWGAKKRLLHPFSPSAHRGYRLFYNVVAGLTLLPVRALLALLPDRTLYGPAPWVTVFILGQLIATIALVAAADRRLVFLRIAPDRPSGRRGAR